MEVDLEVSVDRLEQDTVACERLITRLRARQASNLRALDVRQVDRMDGARSLLEWARVRLDVSDVTTRDLV